MVVMVLKYLFDSLPEYKLFVSFYERKDLNPYLPPKAFLVMQRIVFIVETILFVVACLIFFLKLLGVIPWW